MQRTCDIRIIDLNASSCSHAKKLMINQDMMYLKDHTLSKDIFYYQRIKLKLHTIYLEAKYGINRTK